MRHRFSFMSFLLVVVTFLLLTITPSFGAIQHEENDDLVFTHLIIEAVPMRVFPSIVAGAPTLEIVFIAYEIEIRDDALTDLSYSFTDFYQVNDINPSGDIALERNEHCLTSIFNSGTGCRSPTVG